MQTVIIKDDNLAYAADVIKNGGLAGVPTETVYGIAADAFNASAVSAIYELKGRPAIKPLSLLVADADMAAGVCADFPETAKKLSEKFWPGPLTIVLPCRNTVPSIVTAGGSTIGVRCPDHPKTLSLLRLCTVPLAAPSANISGKQSPKTAQEVLKYFNGKIACIIDGGTCELGFESTIISLVTEPYKILRRGALPENKIAQVLGI